MTVDEQIIFDRIDPRPRLPLEPETFSSAAKAFDAGNYPVALELSKDVDPIYFALSTILCGGIHEGLAYLKNIRALPEWALKVQAYGDWCLGKSNKIKDELFSEGADHIDILLFTMPNTGYQSAFSELEEFNVLSVQLGPDKFGVGIEEVLRDLPESFVPRLILAIDCYGPYLPLHLFEIGIPVAFLTGDHDYFFSTRYHDLNQAHLIIVNSASEHSVFSNQYGARVVAFPCHENYGKQGFSDKQTPEEVIDILFTGRAYRTYMRDKAQQLFRLSCIEDSNIKIKIIDGFLDEDKYMEMVRATRSIPIFWRYAAGFQTRAIDALRHGISVLSPEIGICRSLLGGYNNLYVTIGIDQGEKVAHTRLNSLDSSLTRFDASGRDYMHNMFLPSPAREVRLLKFCLFQTLFLPKLTASRADQFPTPVELKGYDRETGLRAYTSIIGQNLNNPKEVANFNYAGLAGFYAAIISEDNQRLGNLSIRLFKEGILRFPNNAIIRFNYGQVLWVFGRLNEAKDAFFELNIDDNPWQFNPKADALVSHRVRQLARMFPYSDYYRSVESWGTKSVDPVGPLDMIFSATKVYLACADREVGDGRNSMSLLEDAIRLCPNNFAAYREKVTLISDTTNDISSLLTAFYAAVNLYPPVLLELFSYGIDGEVSRGNLNNARELITKFVLFYSRSMNADLKLVKIPLQTNAALRRHLSLLSGWHRSVGEEIIKSFES